VTAGAIRRAGHSAAVLGGAGYSDSFRRTMLIMLYITWMLPIHPILAGQRLDPYRLVLLLTFLPFVSGLFTGKAGRFTATDGLFLGFGFWIVLTLVLHHGVSKFAFGAIVAVEMVGGYAAGMRSSRCWFFCPSSFTNPILAAC
jgi:hypothetical protein